VSAVIEGTSLQKILRFALFVVLVIELFRIGGRLSALTSQDDYLVFSVLDNEQGYSLVVYNPVTHSRHIVYESSEREVFQLSSRGIVALGVRRNDEPIIYLLDLNEVDQQPVDFNQTTNLNGYPLSWSHDGRYLAFASRQEDDLLIYLWNGASVVDVTPQTGDRTPQSYQADWSHDGRLALTAWYGYSWIDGEDVAEIYLWDGDATRSLSQNPTGEDRFAAWNIDGQLAFLSRRGDIYDIFVWDGMSAVNGAPDISTFTNIAPELTAYYSAPTWSPDGQVAFIAQGLQDTHIQIYVWDGQQAVNISRNPTLHNGSPNWNTDGLYAFSTFFSRKQLLYVRDVDHQTIFTVNNASGSAWGTNGELVFCTLIGSDWVLSMWNGERVTEITRGREIYAQWRSGDGISCSSG
jgi:Tol biopolymer transport system component